MNFEDPLTCRFMQEIFFEENSQQRIRSSPKFSIFQRVSVRLHSVLFSSVLFTFLKSRSAKFIVSGFRMENLVVCTVALVAHCFHFDRFDHQSTFESELINRLVH